MKVKMGTIIRTAVLVVALTNQTLTAVGKNPLPYTSTEVEQGISTCITIVAAIVAWWKNNSFTRAAIAGDEYKEVVKADEKI